jgi:predicted phage-related endonuclease
MKKKQKETKQDRTKSIGGSDATRIFDGDWYQLWSEKVGETKPADLSEVLPVQMGITTESLNIQWFERLFKTKIKDKQLHLIHPKYNFITANLDGRLKDGAIFDAKHTNAFSTSAKVAVKYNAQMQHYMMVANSNKSILSVFFGNLKHEVIEIPRDDDFIERLLNAEVLFWHMVTNKIAPPDYISFENFDAERNKHETIPVISRI